jgi:hypothetical protein
MTKCLLNYASERIYFMHYTTAGFCLQQLFKSEQPSLINS